MRILIVDDQAENRYLLEALLKGGGHDVKGLSNGAEAMESLRERDYDLIVSDILMPVMDGFELCRKIRKDDSLRDIPFIVYTATYTGPKDEEFAKMIGANRFIVKPCEPDDFIQAIEETMEAEATRPGSRPKVEENEQEILKLYNERLVRKLEKKMEDLEKEIKRRKEAENTLRARERKYRLLTDNTLDVIWSMSPEMVFTYVNPAIESVSGEPPSRWIGTGLREHVLEEEYGRIIRIVAEEVGRGTEGNGVVFETSVLNDRKEAVPVEIHGRVLFDERGNPFTIQGVARDIRDRKRAEADRDRMAEQLRQSQKMEGIGRLAGGIAHDFNNLMTVVMGYCEMARGKLEGHAEALRDIDEVAKAGKRATDLTRQLLAFSRKQILNPQVLDLNQTAANLEKMLQRILREDIELVFRAHPDIRKVKADRSQIEQVIMNLTVNARDSMPAGGKLTIETSNVDFDEEDANRHPMAEPGSYVMLAVSDSGVGMDEKTLKHIFEPFFTTKKGTKGTGLGLSTVYGIVEQSGGHIEVHSEPDKGTTFEIYLPATRDEKTAERPGPRPRKPSRGSETLLVVEDDAAVRAVVIAMLEGSGYTILEARNGAEAREISGKEGRVIHLLLSDVVMPGMSGHELARQIEKRHPGIKVLFMSGYTDDAIQQRGVSDPDTAFIGKPFTQAELTRKIRNVLDGTEEA